jgi:hypothetical protein
MADKIYCGKAKEVQGQYGTYYRLNLCLSDIPSEHITTSGSGKQYANLDLSMMRARDDKGNTHTLSVNTWKPEGGAKPQQKASQPAPRRQEAPRFAGPEEFQDDSEIPF